MPYAVTLCLDEAAEQLTTRFKTLLSEELKLEIRPADSYAAHVTFGIFEDLTSLNPSERLRHLAGQAHGVPIVFGGVGLLETSDGFTLFFSIIPTDLLLLVHRTVHQLFSLERRSDQYYDIGKWLPHCTIAFGLSNTVSVGTIFNLIPKHTMFRSLDATGIELVFSPDIRRDAVQILYTQAIETPLC
jgi:hypothetical protein